MHNVRELKEDELKQMVVLEQQAYTAYAREKEEDLDEVVENHKKKFHKDDIHFYGVFDQEELVGSMKFYDFESNIFGKYMPTAGVSSIAVDLLHKKERVAKSMIDHYLADYDERGYALAALYAFRPDFYYQMGFGYGSKMDRYKVEPASFPNFKHKPDLTYLKSKEKDLPRMMECYHEYAGNQHGAMKKFEWQYEMFFDKFMFKKVAVERDNKITGYAIFSFKKREINNFLSNDILIHEFVYNDRDALQQLSTFFHSQKDQVNRIQMNTQDPMFHHFFTDARDGSDELITFVSHQTNQSGVGLMYRIINVKEFFNQVSKHNFNGVNKTISFEIKDSLYEKNSGTTTVKFSKGKPTVVQGAKADATVSMDVSNFTSLVLGVATFAKLHQYGKAEISDETFVDTVDELFRTKEDLICLTNF
ncbi:hypothetical protein CEY16_12690 [Halalkalibacillus sediminis]|uniref:N-acetyltransferase domain-containing protein n=1 Tax=Halalkalibacillus sediminis TaxID=2018042 RepID=A0A2I0QRG8_9BACI|nr:GNAT family N-acetyltransferase [Halalkalibacillus sediminis]PKR76670.1 hypothetical protein CEY16_12690 [Halalkalibacillus sediminis]